MLVLNDISLRRGVKLVLDRTSVTLQPGEKIGGWAATVPASHRCSPC